MRRAIALALTVAVLGLTPSPSTSAGEPADAEVLIDGEMTPAPGSDLVVHLSAGWHELEIRRSGYVTLRTNIELSAGETTRLNLKLVR